MRLLACSSHSLFFDTFMLQSIFFSPPHPLSLFFFFFLNDPAPTEIYPLPLHDALPISPQSVPVDGPLRARASRGRRVTRLVCQRASARSQSDRAVLYQASAQPAPQGGRRPDRKSTRLNSSHSQISYAVFCLKKKKDTQRNTWLLTYTGIQSFGPRGGRLFDITTVRALARDLADNVIVDLPDSGAFLAVVVGI